MNILNKVISITQKEFKLAEIMNQIPEDYFLVFFSPIEKIEEITKELSCKYNNVIGASNYKNIHRNGCEYDSISIIGIKVQECRILFIKDVDKSPIRQYKEIQKLKEIYKPGHSMIIEFTDGLSMAEENILTIINTELKDIPLVGGSAGDRGDFKITKVSAKNMCSDKSTALALITTDMFIDNMYENIYELSDITGVVTESDLFNRKIIKIDNKSPLQFYADKLKMGKSDVPKVFLEHPIARILGDDFFIGSISGVNSDETVNLYCRVFNNSYISICNVTDYKALWKKTIEKNNMKYIGGIFVNCYFRTNLFEKDNTVSDFINYLKSYGDFICMTSYGEQYNKSHANQTLCGCMFRER